MPSKTLETLYADHANLSQLLDLMEEELKKFEGGSGETDFETMALVLEYCADYPSHFHHPTEDLIYGLLIRRAPELVRNVVVITADHKTLGQLRASFSNAVGEAISGGAKAPAVALGLDFMRHYREHMRLEESELFPAAEKYLTEDDWREVEKPAGIPVDPLFGDQAREAYLALQRRIVGGGSNDK